MGNGTLSIVRMNNDVDESFILSTEIHDESLGYIIPVPSLANIRNMINHTI